MSSEIQKSQPHKTDRPPAELIRISKKLSYLLRHGAQKEGLQISSDGFVFIEHLLQYKGFKGQKLTVDDVLMIVENDEKKRYALENIDGILRIRANQGHSMVVNVSVETITDPAQIPIAVHGTTHKAWTTIKLEGLKVMSRQHIHLATGKLGDEGVLSGMRKSCSVFIYINISLAMNDGIQFFKSENGVILTSGVDGILHPRYFLRVEDKDGSSLL